MVLSVTDSFSKLDSLTIIGDEPISALFDQFKTDLREAIGKPCEGLEHVMSSDQDEAETAFFMEVLEALLKDSTFRRMSPEKVRSIAWITLPSCICPKRPCRRNLVMEQFLSSFTASLNSLK